MEGTVCSFDDGADVAAAGGNSCNVDTLVNRCVEASRYSTTELCRVRFPDTNAVSLMQVAMMPLQVVDVAALKSGE